LQRLEALYLDLAGERAGAAGSQGE
jgi:hypothetical protein